MQKPDPRNAASFNTSFEGSLEFFEGWLQLDDAALQRNGDGMRSVVGA
jgi:hypothetical protein